MQMYSSTDMGPQQCAMTSERRRARASSLGFVLRFLTASSHHDKWLWRSFGCKPWLSLKKEPSEGFLTREGGGLHSTFPKSFGEFLRRERVLALQEKLIIFRDEFQMAADTSYPEVVDANRRKAKNSVKNPKGSEQEQD